MPRAPRRARRGPGDDHGGGHYGAGGRRRGGCTGDAPPRAPMPGRAAGATSGAGSASWRGGRPTTLPAPGTRFAGSGARA